MLLEQFNINKLYPGVGLSTANCIDMLYFAKIKVFMHHNMQKKKIHYLHADRLFKDQATSLH